MNSGDTEFFWERETEGKDFLQSQQCAKWQTKKSEQICKIDKQIDNTKKKKYKVERGEKEEPCMRFYF